MAAASRRCIATGVTATQRRDAAATLRFGGWRSAGHHCAGFLDNRVEFAIIAVLLGLYCLSFFAMAEFPAFFYALALIGIGIAAYTLTVILICRPHEHSAG